MSELAALLFVAIVLLVWFDSRTVQDIAIAHCRRACEKAGVQFLDDIAPVWRVRLVRDAAGVLRLRRIFTFEYSTPLGERRHGSIVMLGRTPVGLQLEDAPEAERSRTDHFVP